MVQASEEGSAASIIFDAPGNGIGFVELNRPRALNALSRDMLVTLHAQLRRWQDDPSIKAIFVHSSTPRAFCAGGDVKSLYHAAIEGRRDDILNFFIDEYRCNHAIASFPKPYISLLQGIVMGGGMGISQPGMFTGGVRIVTPSTRMAMPETRIGFVPDVGIAYLLGRAPGRLGEYMAVTGESIAWREALAGGFADHAVDDAVAEGLPGRMRETTFASGDQVLSFLRECAMADRRDSETPGESDAGDSGRRDVDALMSKHFAGESVADIVASLAADPHPWAQETLDIIRTRSPLAMALSLAHVRRAANQSFGACLQDDLTLVARILDRGDLVEGIRALLIDKDGQPDWQPSDLRGLVDVDLPQYFRSPWERHPLHDLV